MARGGYGIYVTVSGARGSGTAIVPVNSFATGRLGVPTGLAAILVALGLTLVAGLVTIVRAAAGDSLVPAGAALDRSRVRRANVVTAVSLPVMAVVLFGGAKWWESVDREYQRTLFR